ncbi:alpha/beta-hydrolase [Teratosphaeria nubilosa]|uniref:Kynurenine formamidase n=1 Tax=Teratosphaeria nubilosa TaxID=161662 RepID=A0A6G1LEY3_9PEZI|nr:alpha/beta-hydrolase [Teratosphaeria nubilosa]
MAIPPSPTDGFPQFIHNIQYSHQSNLNTLELCIPRPTTRSGRDVWVVYIHGGAWQDPDIDSSAFKKTRDMLLKSPEADRIAGFASINYRLTAYPAHPREPSNPSDPARNARHPDHINDVLAALLHLQETYRFEDRYILVGHSCGAALAYQVAMKRYWGTQHESTLALELSVVPPIAVLGVEGLYDFPALVKYHAKEPFYQDFITRTFGSDAKAWKAASPTSGQYKESWPDGKLAVLAHSRGDELVEWEQVDLMHKALKGQGFDEAGGERSLKLVEVSGRHDQLWQEGTELARAIRETLQVVKGML